MQRNIPGIRSAVYAEPRSCCCGATSMPSALTLARCSGGPEAVLPDRPNRCANVSASPFRPPDRPVRSRHLTLWLASTRSTSCPTSVRRARRSGTRGVLLKPMPASVESCMCSVYASSADRAQIDMAKPGAQSTASIAPGRGRARATGRSHEQTAMRMRSKSNRTRRSASPWGQPTHNAARQPRLEWSCARARPR
jgi:hypothetical protein